MAQNTRLGAVGSGGEFEGFDPKDFAAYEKKKWASNVYTLERRNAKDRLLALARTVLSELESDFEGLEIGASDEAPTVNNARKVHAQWVFFTRDAEDRHVLKTLLEKTDLQSGAGLFDISIQHQHACLVLRLDLDGLAVGLEIAGKAKVDRENMRMKLSQSWAVPKFVEHVKALPGDAKLGFGDALVGALDVTPETVEAWAGEFEASTQPFTALLLLEKSDEILTSKQLIGTVASQIEPFVSLYHFMAWSRENDSIQLKGALQKASTDKKKVAAAAFEAGARVTILSGMFAGRGGYLAEIDAKGKAKVMVGPVSVTVDLKDLKGH